MKTLATIIITAAYFCAGIYVGFTIAQSSIDNTYHFQVLREQITTDKLLTILHTRDSRIESIQNMCIIDY